MVRKVAGEMPSYTELPLAKRLYSEAMPPEKSAIRLVGGHAPFTLEENRVSYLVPGGRMLDEFYGHGPMPGGMRSQAWIASVVESAIGDGEAGLSRLSAEFGGGLLRDVLSKRADELLGERHAAKLGPNPGILVKLLHSDWRLLIQVHPDKEKALRYFGSPFGKTEAWYVIETGDKPAYIWAGFKPHVTREAFLRLIEIQDSTGMLDCLHRFEVRKGDTVIIRAGMPHALGPDCLVAEVQEPVDITLRAEHVRPDGIVMTEESMHGGIGMDGMLDCFSFDGKPESETRENIFIKPSSHRLDGGDEKRLITSRDTSCFSMSGLTVVPGEEMRRKNRSFAVALVIAGSGRVVAEGRALSIRRGSELFLPYGMGSYAYQGEERLQVLEFYPPEGQG